MSEVIHEHRRRAQSFGEDAPRYDQARPSYPAALVDDLMAETPARVLDVGCGTGIAARLFLARGCDVLGVEHDERMAAVARAHGVPVEVAAFETWEPPGRPFDLVISGQAWHWVDPTVGSLKAAAVLAPGGRFAAFWNGGHHEPAVAAAFDEVYRRHAPALRRDSVPLGTLRRDNAAETEALAACGLFDATEVRTYPWRARHSRDQWLDRLPTHSDHRLLPAEQLAALLEGVGAAIDRLGGEITVHYETRLLTTLRRG